jgi:hypothetical protein
MKQLSAILLCALLVWAPFAPAQALPAKPVMNCCGGACCHMACCAAKNSSDPQSLSAVPVQKTGSQNQISLLVSTVVAWTLPAYPADSISSASASPSITMDAPLYARNCSLLL